MGTLCFVTLVSFFHALSCTLQSNLLQFALQMVSHNWTVLTVSSRCEAETTFVGMCPLCFLGGEFKGQNVLCEALYYKQHEAQGTSVCSFLAQ